MVHHYIPIDGKVLANFRRRIDTREKFRPYIECDPKPTDFGKFRFYDVRLLVDTIEEIRDALRQLRDAQNEHANYPSYLTERVKEDHERAVDLLLKELESQ